MTGAQKSQFELFGCVSRCLLMIAREAGISLSQDEYVARFLPTYREFWSTHCGCVNTGMMLDIARELKIASWMQVYRSPRRVRDHINRGEAKFILLATESREVLSAEGVKIGFEDFMHCRIVVCKTGMGQVWEAIEVADGLVLGNPLQITDSALDRWGALFHVFGEAPASPD